VVWNASVANNGRFECNEMFCHDEDARDNPWSLCPEDPDGEVTAGENFHYLTAPGGLSTGKWFQLEWREPTCLCQIWIDTKSFSDRCPFGRDTVQRATNRVLNADMKLI
jgi:hypothetical protein